MLSKNKIKFIQSLQNKKIREQEKVFLVEGDKIVMEAIFSNQDIRLLCATDSFLTSLQGSTQSSLLSLRGTKQSLPSSLRGTKQSPSSLRGTKQSPPSSLRGTKQSLSLGIFNIEEIISVTEEELQKASLMQSPQNALAVVGMPKSSFNISSVCGNLSLALDFIQDPGNLGTIIRLADWFGINHLLCSENTVDCYNPKVIQSSMGSIFRVNMHYLNLPQTLDEANRCELPVYGTFLEGDNIYRHPLSENGILVIGNEGNGISLEVAEKIEQKLFIPPFPVGQKTSESLNAATATAICCSEFRRRFHK